MARSNIRRACERSQPHPSATTAERGAILPLLGGLLMVILLAGALAVDLSAIERRGQTLQNTADAAALAGVATWVESNDAVATRSIIEDVVEQNGLDLGADIDLQIDYISATRVEVELVDTEPDVFLAGVIGQGSDVERAAAAELERCDTSCNRTIEMPEPLQPTEALGSGDGFLPTAVGTRLYAVNHHSTTIGCLERMTGAPCWPAQPLFSGGGLTGNVLVPAVVDERIYYTGWNGTFLESTLTCWDHQLDARCANEEQFGNHGHSTLVEANGRLYVFTSSRQVFCFVPPALSSCTGYETGKDTQLAGDTTWVISDSSAYSSSFRVHDQRIYHVLSNDGMLFLHCWDLRTHLPCAGFGSHWLNATSPGTFDSHSNGRLFFARNPSGTPTSICALGQIELQCHDFVSGDRLTAEETQFQDLETAVSARPLATWPGLIYYHALSNRIFTVNAEQSYVYCHDFDTPAYCGEEQPITTLGVPRTYGFIGEGNCLIGLGHESIFYSMQPDMTSECTGSSRTAEIRPCTCSGAPAWPPIEAVGTGLLSTFEVRVLAPNGNLILPDDGSDAIDLLNEDLDLSPISFAYPYITLELYVEALPTTDPWSQPEIPGIELGYEGHPHLVN